MTNTILTQDLDYIKSSIKTTKFENSIILITGAAGFLGYYFVNFFTHFSEELKIKKIIALDNFLTGSKEWLVKLANENPDKLILEKFDVISGNIGNILNSEDADIIIHLASIASPTFYRKYPIETMDANILGLRKLLDYYKEKPIKSFLVFSSSEVYGDPDPNKVPLEEDYRGNVSTIGPRACYDEAKRFGETMSYLFAEKYNLPIRIVRPFNNYGPGMSLNDKRVPADFAKAVFENRDIEIFSDGTPMRTFCYISDAITGYLKVIAYNKFDIFNIGIDEPEISVKQLADIYASTGKKLFNYNGVIKLTEPQEKEYLTHNPNRRCPSINKAKFKLDFHPTILVNEGVERFLNFVKQNSGEL